MTIKPASIMDKPIMDDTCDTVTILGIVSLLAFAISAFVSFCM